MSEPDFDDVARCALKTASEHFARHIANDETAEAVCAWVERSMREFGYPCDVSYRWLDVYDAGPARRALHFTIAKRPTKVAFVHTVKS